MTATDSAQNRFAVGQQVRVLFEGKITEVHQDRLFVQARSSRTNLVWLVPFPSYTITVLEPAGWPPQKGDIWAAAGKEWFARWSQASSTILFIPDDSGAWAGLQDFREMSPVLVRRRLA